MVSKSNTKAFYESLNRGGVSRGVLGIDQRFNVHKILGKNNINENFVKEISPFLNKKKVVLDLGCGPGAFSISIADKCKMIYSIDIVKDFVISAQQNALYYKKNNIITKFQANEKIPAKSNFFDVVLLVDVLHHVENIDDFLIEIKRVLKTNGYLIIFEPNKLNPLMYAMHWLDDNERGLLKLGRPNIYRKKLENFFTIKHLKFSGLVIGPDSKIFDYIVNFLKIKIINIFIGWLLPKIFIVGKKSE